MTAINTTDLNNAKLDVDHIAAIATSNSLTATDRLGNTKDTIKGVLNKYEASGVMAYTTLTSLQAVTTKPSGTVAWVTEDPTEIKNGYYRWTGSAWSKTTQQPLTESSLTSISEDIAALESSIQVEVENRSELIQKSLDVTGANIANIDDIFEDTIPEAKKAWLDEEDNVIAVINDESKFDFTPKESSNNQVGLRAGVCHILGIGQSWMGGTGGAPAITTTAQDNILMFVGGIRPKDTLTSPACYASLVGAVESNNAGNIRGETPISGFSRALADTILAEEGTSLASLGTDILVSVVAPGGQVLSNFVKNGIYFTEIMEQVTAGYARAQALGETYRLLCCPFIMGKGDYDEGEVSKEAFKTAFSYLIKDVNTAVKALVHDHPDIPFFVYQTTSHGHSSRKPTIDLALVELDRENPLVTFVGILSAYQRTTSDTTHYSAAAYKAIGRVGGILAKKYLYSGKKPNAMLPVESVVQGKVISLVYSPEVLPIVFDDTAANNPTNHGFNLIDSSGSSLAVSSITVKGNRVVIVASSSLPTGWKLQYATVGTYATNSVSGPRGSLRDSANPPNWAGLFEINK